MTNKVNIRLEKKVYSVGTLSFSTKYDQDLVQKWMDDFNTGGYFNYTGLCDTWNEDVDSWDKTEEEVFPPRDGDTDFFGGEGDEDCPYDERIQGWINGEKEQ